MCQCKVIEYVIGNIFRVWHFADGPLGLVSQTPAHRDQRILYRAEESLFWGNLACSSFSTPLEKKRGVICVLKTFCSRVIDPEKSNLSISCQLYRTRLQCVCSPCALRMLCRSSTDSFCFHTGHVWSPVLIRGCLPQTQHLSIILILKPNVVSLYWKCFFSIVILFYQDTVTQSFIDIFTFKLN